MNIEQTQNAISISDVQYQYHLKLFDQSLKDAFPDGQNIECRVAAHPDGSPIPLASSADRVLLFSIYEGDNWSTVFSELNVLADAFTTSNYGLPPNAKELGIFFVDLEGRRDRLDEKILEDSLHRAVVIEQGIPHRALARSLAANGVKFACGINDHSNNIHAIYKDAGILHIPLSTEAVLIDRLWSDGIINEQTLPDIVLGTTDIGGLKEIATAKRYMDYRFSIDVPVATIYKFHVPTGVDFITTKESEFKSGNVKGKFVLIIDDRSDSVDSIIKAVDIYDAQGASQVGIYITHPVFAKEEYYNNIRRLLVHPKVSFFFTSNSLPMDKYRISRLGGVKTPWTFNTSSGQKERIKMQTLDIHPFIIEAARTILTSPTIEDAITVFDSKHQLLDMRDPYDIYQEITGSALPKPKIVGYYKDGEVYKFDSPAK